jgi:rubrerythrin
MTNNTFTESEMFKVAMLMEDEGYNFYINGANHTTGKTKEFLLVAAGQEFIHKEKFTKLFNQAFNKEDKPRDAFTNLKTAITHAIKSEELTINIYTQMYEKSSQNNISEMLSIIIEEEKEHAAYFSKLLAEIVA